MPAVRTVLRPLPKIMTYFRHPFMLPNIIFSYSFLNFRARLTGVRLDNALVLYWIL
jgi:hypothetical protein